MARKERSTGNRHARRKTEKLQYTLSNKDAAKAEQTIRKNSDRALTVTYIITLVLYSNTIENHELIAKSKEDYSGERFWIIGSERPEDEHLITEISNVLKMN